MQHHPKAQTLAPRPMVLSLFLVIQRLRATASALDCFARPSPAGPRLDHEAAPQGSAHPISLSHCLNFGSRLDTLTPPRPCCYCSVAQLCPTLCDPTDYSTPGFPVHHHLLDFAQTHVRRVGDTIHPYNHLSSPSHLALNLS